MIQDFTISDKIIKRPNSQVEHFIPDSTFDTFWIDFYEHLRITKNLDLPFPTEENSINPYFGYFGYRFHPITFKPNYFHIGIDIDKEIGAKVHPIANGIFEYSGYGNQNGTYLMLSHPQIQTKDGYKMYSLYLHLEKALLSFNLLQKTFRSVGFIKSTNRQILKDKVIGISGDSGNSKDIFPHLHLQIEFRKQSENKVVIIDPAKAIGLNSRVNLTKDIQTFSDFKKFYLEHSTDLINWSKTIKNYENANSATKNR